MSTLSDSNADAPQTPDSRRAAAVLCSALLPCPFCGNAEPRTSSRPLSGGEKLYWVDCATDGCCIFRMGEFTEAAAAAKWNNRPVNGPGAAGAQLQAPCREPGIQQLVGLSVVVSGVLPSNRLENVKRRAVRAMGETYETIVTCPASRHTLQMANALATGKPILDEFPGFGEYPQHCAGSIYAVLESLWKARAEIKRLRHAANSLKLSRQGRKSHEIRSR